MDFFKKKCICAVLGFLVVALGVDTTYGSKPADSFAKISLALKGCSSCGSCKTNLRQTLKASSKAEKVSLKGNGKVEMVYLSPQMLNIRDIVKSMGVLGMKDSSVVDVLLEATGKLEKKKDEVYFILEKTGQEFLIEHAPVSALGEASAMHLKAVVKGWEKETSHIVLAIKQVEKDK